MRKVPLVESLRIIGRGSLNWLAERPIVVSFEVTDACTCWCKHCDHGGPKDESHNLKPAAGILRRILGSGEFDYNGISP